MKGIGDIRGSFWVSCVGCFRQPFVALKGRLYDSPGQRPGYFDNATA